ncbi:MAG: prolyl-tRNA synthetase associated domain-containing protein [Bacteroidetes bacterium]|nr:MAG: prolyl-tRNA synthetase associated domain-containing protein [Bacteroidota bacterium]
MTKREQVLQLLDELNIPYDIYDHPPVPTVEEALVYWKEINATHCKNLFFRNHKGNLHYLVILEHQQQLKIKDLEQRLKQGKISFASPQRMERYLGLNAGSVSVFGLINDRENHVHLFLDAKLKAARKISFHPNENTATVIISLDSFLKFLDWTGNSYEFITLYDQTIN